jgi:ATP synthase protein I
VKQETKYYLKDLYQQFTRASTIGLALALSVVIGAIVGYYVDIWIFGKTKLFFFIFLIMGIIAGFRNVYILGKRFQKKM